ncbi:rho guanine nucleotide exchange factor 10-like isoform X2 [Argopecten irradians]|uniref:rho guanine nucleotide exchange factor 10-like isoform X2 n=1 Tax=Argopecten irradians TaxID=31199 RepID=UPI0037241AA7
MAANQEWPPGGKHGDSEAVYASVPNEEIRPKLDSSDDDTDLYVDAFSTVQGQGQNGDTGMDFISNRSLGGTAPPVYDVVKAPVSLYDISKPVADMWEPPPMSNDGDKNPSIGQAELLVNETQDDGPVFNPVVHSDFPVYELAKNVTRSSVDEEPESPLPELKIVEEDIGVQDDNFYEAVCGDNDISDQAVSEQGVESNYLLQDNGDKCTVDDVPQCVGDRNKPACIQEEKTKAPHIVAENQTEAPPVVEENQTEAPHLVEENQTKAPHAVEENQTKAPHVVEENQTKAPHAVDENQTKAPHAVEENQTEAPQAEPVKLLTEADYKKDDKFIYDLAGPIIDNENNVGTEEKVREPTTCPVCPEVAPKPLRRKESLPGKKSLRSSGVYEEISIVDMLPQLVKSSVKPKIKKRQLSGGKSQRGGNKGDTQKRGTATSQRVPGWPPESSDGTLYTDVYYPGDDDEYALSLDGGSTDSEFDTISDQEEAELAEVDDYPDKPLPKPPPKNKGIFERMKINKSINKKIDKFSQEEASPCLPVKLDTKRHPPPEMPAPPADLTEKQNKKRKVIESIINSEKSYIDSLDRVVNIFKRPLLYSYGLEAKESKVKDVFNKTQEILNYHLMFQLELAECVKNWDETEKIGDIFTASFSRAMVVDVYSDYVNKFSTAMEEIKRAQNAQPGLRKFLQEQEHATSDRLSIFGLMVKPVQRFPQFIMFMQDLLKYTPPNHHDRCALQRALTELENVAHRLNESKRDSEQYLEAKRLIKKLGRTLSDRSQKLLRQDNFEQMTKANGEIVMKKRRLILMDDCLIVIGVTYRDNEDRRAAEQLKVKSCCALVNLELKDSSISPDMQSSIITSSRRTSIQTKAPLKPEDDPFHLYNDLSNMMHDLSVLGKIGALVSSLQNTYEGLSEDLVIEVTRDLQQMIQVKDQQLQLLNSCTINVHDTLKNIRYTFQTQTPEMKQEWCKEFLMAKFALEPQNNPGWLKAEDTNSLQPAVFMKSVCVDMPRNYTKMKCAVPVFLSAPGTIDIGIQHLWVVMTTEKRTQVALVSTQSTKPALVESFQAMDVEAVAVEMVQGYATVDTDDAFVEDTVWMSTISSEIMVFRLFNEVGRRDLSTTARKPATHFYCHGIAMVIRAMDDRVFVGCNNGNLVIYDRDAEGRWNFRSPTITIIDSVPIRSILVMEEEIWLSCRDYVYIIQYEENTYSEKVKMSSNEGGSEISEMVRSGVGLWVSYKDQSRVCLFHIETKENLQEVNVKGAVERMVSSCPTYAKEKSTDNCMVTSLMTSRGYLWIGTNVGIILTVSLPRLKDGVPRYWDKPWVSCHAHNGPVKLLIPVYCDTVNLWQLMDGASQMAGNNSGDDLRKTSSSAEPETERKKSSSSAEPESSSAETEGSERKNSLGIQVLPTEKEDVLIPLNASHLTLRGGEAENASAKSLGRFMRHPNSSLPFRRELLETVQKKRLGTVRKSNLLDNVSSEDEVSLYYHDLMTFDEGSDSSKNSDLSDTLSVRELAGKMDDVVPTTEESKTKNNTNVLKPHKELKPKKSFSIRKTLSKGKQPNVVRTSLSLKLPPGEHNGPRMKAINTLSKRNCNAVIVISGGDGYLDWKRPPSDQQKEYLRNDESSLMMWMYKF